MVKPSRHWHQPGVGHFDLKSVNISLILFYASELFLSIKQLIYFSPKLYLFVFLHIAAENHEDFHLKFYITTGKQ